MPRLPRCPLYSSNLVPSLQPGRMPHVRWTEADRVVETMYRVTLDCLCFPQHSWLLLGHRSTLSGLCPILYTTPHFSRTPHLPRSLARVICLAPSQPQLTQPLSSLHYVMPPICMAPMVHLLDWLCLPQARPSTFQPSSQPYAVGTMQGQ